MNLNLLTPAEQEAQREYADIKEWAIACRTLGALPEQLAAYENAAQAFARTTLYPNSAIMVVARRAAKEALMRGEPLPTDVEAAIQQVFARDLAKLIGAL